jgi:hypothetical protein
LLSDLQQGSAVFEVAYDFVLDVALAMLKPSFSDGSV